MAGKPPPPTKKPTTLAGTLAAGRRGAGDQLASRPPKLAQKSQAVAEAKATHRQRVWDKLDAARQAALEKKKRLSAFATEKAEGDTDDEDFEI